MPRVENQQSLISQLNRFRPTVILSSRRIMTEPVEASLLLFFLVLFALPTQRWSSHFVNFCGKSLPPVMRLCERVPGSTQNVSLQDTLSPRHHKGAEQQPGYGDTAPPGLKMGLILMECVQ